MILFFLNYCKVDGGILKTVAIRKLFNTIIGYMFYCNKKSTQF